MRGWAGVLVLGMGLAACGQEPSEACAGYVAAADTCFTAAENAGLDVDVEPPASAREACAE